MHVVILVSKSLASMDIIFIGCVNEFLKQRLAAMSCADILKNDKSSYERRKKEGNAPLEHKATIQIRCL